MITSINRPSGFDPTILEPPQLRQGPYPVISLAIDISGSCNMACRYCAESAVQPRRHTMSPEALEKTLNYIIRDGRPIKGSSISLGCGEPLLAFPLMKKLREIIESIASSSEEQGNGEYVIPVSLTTNASLIDDEIMEWLISSGWTVKISLDGPDYIHDKWRVFPDGKGTFDRISKRVALMAERAPDRVRVSSVLCKGTDPQDVFEGIEKLGIRKIEMVPAAHRSESILPGPEDLEKYRQFLHAYVKRFVEAEKGNLPPALLRLELCVLRAMGYQLSRIPCDAGRSFVAVGPDGDFYPCFRFVGLDSFKIGTIYNGVDQEAAKVFQQGVGRPYHERKSCIECWAAPLCTGPCYSCAEMFGTQNGEPIPIQCEYTKANAEAALLLIEQLRERNPERLISFLPNINFNDFFGDIDDEEDEE